MTAAGRPFFVVTGGPGSGKSTLLQTLAPQGFACMEEAGRAIIRDQVASGGTALPWADTRAFAALMLAFDIRSYHRAEALDAGPVLFDRGIPDVVGFLQLTGSPIPRACDEAARCLRYHKLVFAAPPWREIFAQDAERKQTFAEAEATYAAVKAAYENYGYEPVLLPLDTVAARATFVRETIKRFD